MVEDVGEGTLGPKANAFEEVERFAQTRREAHAAGTSEIPDTLRAEAADRC